MAVLAPQSELPLALAIVLIAAAVGFFVFARRHLQRKKQRLALEVDRSPALREDRAYNRIRMARGEADILARSGMDVERARKLLAEAETAYEHRRFDTAFSLADSAHNFLISTRRPSGNPAPRLAAAPSAARGTAGSLTFAGPPGVPSTPAPGRAAPGVEAPGATRPPAAPNVPASNRLAKHRAEARFVLSVLSDEIRKRRIARPNDPSAVDAEANRKAGETAYARGQYTEALRLALRGRRRLGVTVESLPLLRGDASAGPLGPAEGVKPTDPSELAMETSTGDRCPSCGFPVSANDRYCRGCGAARRGVDACPKCGAAGKPGDAFCGECGSPMA